MSIKSDFNWPYGHDPLHCNLRKINCGYRLIIVYNHVMKSGVFSETKPIDPKSPQYTVNHLFALRRPSVESACTSRHTLGFGARPLQAPLLRKYN